MEQFLGKGVEGLANVVANKWYAAMGFIGLLLFAASLVFEMPTEQTIVTCVALIMFGYGFGQAECRTFKQHIGHGFKLTGPAWRLTVSGFLLFAIAAGATLYLGWHLLN
ncbi:MAG: hypothetical protein ACU0AU_04990 [Cognatishimia activa]